MLFVMSSSALVFYFYYNTAIEMAHQIDRDIKTDLDIFSHHYNRGGIKNLARIVKNRSHTPRLGLYLLVDGKGRVLEGNLTAKPHLINLPDNWVGFEYRREMMQGEKMHAARGRFIELPRGYYLLVSRDIEDLRQFERLMQQSIFFGVPLVLALGLGGGLLMSRNFRRRIDSMNRTSRQIMQGDLSRRVPLKGTGDEIDQLAENLNAMLDRIEDLMSGLRDVTDNIAHDLRSPLNRMRNRLEVTLMDTKSAENYREALQKTIEEADGLLVTFNALLSISRLESGSALETMELQDVVDLTMDAAEFLQPIAEERGFDFHCETPDGTIFANISRPLLSQAIVNLLDNAFKYGGGEKNKVKLSVLETPHHITIRVSDWGLGVPADYLARITKRFVRLDESRSSQGSGLGLSLVSAIAQLHKGELSLFANEPNGLVAELKLPKAV